VDKALILWDFADGDMFIKDKINKQLNANFFSLALNLIKALILITTE